MARYVLYENHKSCISCLRESNPFNFKDPLHFFHLGAFHILATAVGSFISVFFQNPKFWFTVLLYFFAGVGTWLGVQLCQIAYKKKYSVD